VTTIGKIVKDDQMLDRASKLIATRAVQDAMLPQGAGPQDPAQHS